MDDKHRADLRERQLNTCNKHWYRAAVEALAGNDRALRIRVAMYEAPAAVLVASED